MTLVRDALDRVLAARGGCVDTPVPGGWAAPSAVAMLPPYSGALAQGKPRLDAVSQVAKSGFNPPNHKMEGALGAQTST